MENLETRITHLESEFTQRQKEVEQLSQRMENLKIQTQELRLISSEIEKLRLITAKQILGQLKFPIFRILYGKEIPDDHVGTPELSKASLDLLERLPVGIYFQPESVEEALDQVSYLEEPDKKLFLTEIIPFCEEHDLFY